MAIIIKRQSVDDYGEDRRAVLEEVQQLIAGSNSSMQVGKCDVFKAEDL